MRVDCAEESRVRNGKRDRGRVSGGSKNRVQ